MKKLIALVIVVVILALGALMAVRFISGEDTWICQNGQWVKHGEPSKPKPASVCGEIVGFNGIIKEVDYEKLVSAGRMVITMNGIDKELILMDDVRIVDDSGEITTLANIYKKFEISGKGSIATDNVINASEIKVDKAPNIIIFEPLENTEIGLPIEITGVARVFENNLNVRVKDKEGNVLGENNVMAASPDMGKFGEFKFKLNYAEPKTDEGYVEAFDYSAKDGTVENLDSVAVRFGTIDAQIIKAFYSSTKKDPAGRYCSRTYAVDRRIPKTDAPARAALEEMLLGPTNSESRDGYFSSMALSPRIEIQKLVIENGTAKVDFNNALNMQGGGSCKMLAIRSQIESTLKQFATIKKVEISVDGNVDEVLQP